MRRKLNLNYSNKYFGKHQTVMTTFKYQNEDRNLKPAEEWIYGTLNKIASNSTINFRNQKAFKGYQKKNIDLYMSFILFNIFILVL